MRHQAKNIGAAALLIAFSMAGQALTLGSLRGPVIIGRALDLTIPVQVEQADDAIASCFEAEVFHGDVRQPASGIRMGVEKAAGPSAIQVRIQSSALVNEPVVSLTLRTRCGLKTERRYVVLADIPKGIDLAAPIQIGAPSAAPTPLVSASKVDSPQAANAVTLPVVSANEPTSRSKRAAPAKAVGVKKESRKSISKKEQPVAKSATTPSVQSRLQLDNLELFSDRISLLDIEQPDAATEYVSPDQQKLQAMQGKVDALQSVVDKKEASLIDLQTQLSQSESERFPAWLVYVLAALILAAMAVIAVLWSRQRRAQAEDGEWWGASVSNADSKAEAVVPPIRSAPVASVLPLPVNPPKVEPKLAKPVNFASSSQWPESRTHGVDVDEVEMGESRFNRYLESGDVSNSAASASIAQPLDFVLPESQFENSVLVAEMRQQAEFFVALGQTDQAVVVLEKLIRDSEVPNPNVYLDLLGLLHSLSKKIEFQRCRDAFNRAFNGVVPEFVRFRSEGKSLEDYPEVLDDVVAHWTTPEALDCVNAYVARPKTKSQLGLLDLAAFRELLLLQAIAQQLRAEPMVPIIDAELPQQRVVDYVEPANDGDTEPPLVSMMDLDLDLDLSEAAEEIDSGSDALPNPDAPRTISTGLKDDDASAPHNHNMIDFDMPDAIKPNDPDTKS